MLKSSLVALALVLPVLSCGANEGDVAVPDAPAAEVPAAKAQTVALESATRELRCGCKIDSIGKCGNYVADGEDWLKISNGDDHDLHVMEWCRVPAEVHVMGKVAGERTGDTIKVSELLVDR